MPNRCGNLIWLGADYEWDSEDSDASNAGLGSRFGFFLLFSHSFDSGRSTLLFRNRPVYASVGGSAAAPESGFLVRQKIGGRAPGIRGMLSGMEEIITPRKLRASWKEIVGPWVRSFSFFLPPSFALCGITHEPPQSPYKDSDLSPRIIPDDIRRKRSA